MQFDTQCCAKFQFLQINIFPKKIVKNTLHVPAILGSSQGAFQKTQLPTANGVILNIVKKAAECGYKILRWLSLVILQPSLNRYIDKRAAIFRALWL